MSAYPNQVHRLKLHAKYFGDVFTGRKKFEVRKNDREFQPGDVVVLREWDGMRPTGREICKTVGYVLTGDMESRIPGLADDHCIFSLEDIPPDSPEGDA